jgi:hypothetical protein
VSRGRLHLPTRGHQGMSLGPTERTTQLWSGGTSDNGSRQNDGFYNFLDVNRREGFPSSTSGCELVPVVPTVCGVMKKVCGDAHLHFRELADKRVEQVCCKVKEERCLVETVKWDSVWFI